MSVLALLDCTTHVAGHDFTTDTNQAAVQSEAAALEKTTFGSAGWTELHGGLKSLAFAYQGFWQSAASDAVDVEAFTDLGVANRVHTFGPVPTEATTAYLFRAGNFAYNLGGTIGELAPFTLNSQGTNGEGVIRGQWAKKKGNVSATGVLGSGVNLGAGAAGKFLYATLHAFSVGTTITVEIQSATTSAFTTPTTRATFTAVTARGGSWLPRVDASAITDTWWRMNVTAITGTFSVAGAIAIQ